MSAATPEAPEGLSRGDIFLTVFVSVLVIVVLTLSLIAQQWTNALSIAGLGVVYAGIVVGSATTPKSQKTTPAYRWISTLALIGVLITATSFVVDYLNR